MPMNELMKTWFPCILLVLVLLVIDTDSYAGTCEPYGRIISFAPSITEVLYSLDLGDCVAGVTSFCNYPAAAKRKPRLGGFFDPNIEAVLALKPDLVLMLPSSMGLQKQLKAFGVECRIINHKSLDNIISSIRFIGDLCHVPDRARALSESLNQRIEAVKKRCGGCSKSKVLVVIGRDYSSPRPGQFYAAGSSAYYQDLISIAGGINVIQTTVMEYPALSPEGIISLDPDIILELIPGYPSGSLQREPLMAAWRNIPGLRAVAEGKVFLCGQDYVSVPGPRAVDLLENFAKLIHPEVFIER